MNITSNSAHYTLNPDARTLVCDPHTAEFYQNPYALYADLHRSCPTFLWKDYGHWCFAGWDDVNKLFRDKRFGRQILHVATREELGMPQPLQRTQNFDATEAHSLLALEPPEHTRLRTLVNRAFVSRQVEQLRPKIELLSNDLISSFESNSQIDLIPEYAAPIAANIIADMLGIPANMAPQLLDWSHRMVAMYMFGRTEKTEHDADLAAYDFADYIKQTAAEKRTNPGDDLISLMLTSEIKGQKLTEAELVSTSILLLNAGHEATVHQAGNGIKAILESGLDPANLFETPQNTAATVEECLRFDAPLHMFTRFALENIDLGDGIELKKGDEIGLLLAAANHDPTKFAAPEAFNPDRAIQANISFGAGIHFCLGAPLARIELQTAMQTLFTRLPNLKLDGAPQYANGYHFHGLEKLMVSWN